MLVVIAYSLVITFLALEVALRERTTERSVYRVEEDWLTPRLLLATYVVALMVAPLLRWAGVGMLPVAPLFSVLGLLAILGGVVLRVWAAQALGKFYTPTLKVVLGQPVIESGPYWIVRHPGYLASILLWVGLGLVFANWLATFAVAALVGLAFALRIQAEESLLLASFGSEYQRYMTRTWRLVPGLY